ncbi:hypothetical protein LDBPK_171420 [Leishmania donovani]|uniref:Uncharacterized protein n=1 Tax=Leishmania donovani TaxID=5661 RepID=E9BDG4_LEIDO|nr:hypothetical protein LDBPK_171420 [Leishmania donovani]CBZ33290.1 hypothetical protein LDBPK_171420 [Leishmania donovani]
MRPQRHRRRCTATPSLAFWLHVFSCSFRLTFLSYTALAPSLLGFSIFLSPFRSLSTLALRVCVRMPDSFAFTATPLSSCATLVAHRCCMASPPFHSHSLNPWCAHPRRLPRSPFHLVRSRGCALHRCCGTGAAASLGPLPLLQEKKGFRMPCLTASPSLVSRAASQSTSLAPPPPLPLHRLLACPSSSHSCACPPPPTPSPALTLPPKRVLSLAPPRSPSFLFSPHPLNTPLVPFPLTRWHRAVGRVHNECATCLCFLSLGSDFH